MNTGDGITHINIYSQGQTELGKMLSNFYHYPFTTSEGVFESIEGYWYYLGLEKNNEVEMLKQMWGSNAKSWGQMCKRKYKIINDEHFKDKILDAVWFKIINNLHFFTLEYKNLPVQHYYVYNNVIKNAYDKCPWLIDEIQKLKDYIYSNILMEET